MGNRGNWLRLLNLDIVHGLKPMVQKNLGVFQFGLGWIRSKPSQTQPT